MLAPLDTAGDGADCPLPAGDRACYVYSEPARAFFFWGFDSALRLTGRALGSTAAAPPTSPVNPKGPGGTPAP